MIKKIYTTLIIVGLFGISNVFAYTEIQNCYKVWTSCNKTTYDYASCYELENNDEIVRGNFTYKVDNNANISTYYTDWGEYYNTAFSNYIPSQFANRRYNYMYRGSDNKLHSLISLYNEGIDLTIGKVCIINSINITEIAEKCGYNTTLQICDTNSCHKNYTGDIQEFYNTNGGFDKIFYLANNSSTLPGTFCFSKNGTTYCILQQMNSKNYHMHCDYGEYIHSPDLKFNTETGTQYIANVSSLFHTSPFNGQSGGGDGEQITIRTGKNYYCPTFGQLLEMQPNNYNTGLCYNGTLKYENGQITTVQKQDIQTVFTDYQEYQQYIYLYNNYCTGPATQQTCENAFNGEREKYSIIANAMNNKVDDKELWNYCNIWLNYDLNATTCVANQSGYIEEKPTQQELIDYIENLGNIGEINTPTSGNILNSLIGSGDTREDIATRDLFGQLDQIKEKTSTIFNERNGVNGVIPDYILWLILTTLLLTVLFKK